MAHARHAGPVARGADPRHGCGRQGGRRKDLRSLRQQGIAIIVFSTEPETILSLADRVVVMRKGEVAREFADEVISKDRLLAAA